MRCPLAAMHNYLQIFTAEVSRLFIHFEGQPLTCYQFITILKRCLDIMGIDSSNYNLHLYRKGGKQPSHCKALIIIITLSNGLDVGVLMHLVHASVKDYIY